MVQVRSHRRVWNLLGRLFGPRMFLSSFRSRHKGANPERIFFICSGNICRSPYAEYCARKLLSNSVTLLSRGLFTPVGKKADENAQRIALENGIDLSAHSTRPFDPAEIGPMDLLLVMDRGHFQEIVNRAPMLKPMTVMLGAFGIARGLPLVIDDPWGKDDEFFRRCFEQIDICISELKAELKG